MKQYQHFAALANVMANDMDLYDVFADEICGQWGYPEILGDISETEFWDSLRRAKFRLSEISAMLDDYRLSVLGVTQ